MIRAVAVLGLGEAGSRYAADLIAARQPVAWFDPDPAAARRSPGCHSGRGGDRHRDRAQPHLGRRSRTGGAGDAAVYL
jgi:3-hydroxyisobutyrate dehydrogenase-like beta-hydroxyacid dehydrogenase